MTTDVLFIQGGGAGAHAADQAMADELGRALGAGFRVDFPRMPHEADPDKGLWTDTIVKEARQSGASFLVAHSVSAAITADILAQGLHRSALPALSAILLLAPPFIGRGGWAFDGYHLDTPGLRVLLDRLPVHFYFGDEDHTVPLEHADLYARAFPDATIHRLTHCDHQFAGHLESVAQTLRVVDRR